ncbi:hypothetical protein AB0K27_09605 [Micromonospora echinospora]|uniref:hypothetical protein n=1 Tax=Micromonospora echinospora TaxID=1877 RepID=UPI00343102DE
MSDDDERELARLAERHLAAAHAFLEHFRTAPAFIVEPENVRAFNATYPLVAHAMNQIAAALVLRVQGLGYAARANARVALEHALIAQSVVHTHDGEEPLIGSMDKLQRNILRDMRTGGAVLSPDLNAEIDSPWTRPETKLQEIADRFDNGSKAIYGLYRILTGAVHVSLTTLTAYLQPGANDRPPKLLKAAKPDTDSDQVLALGWSAVLAVSAIESFRKGDRYRGWINAMAKDHELVADLGSFDSQPHRQRRRSS